VNKIEEMLKNMIEAEGLKFYDTQIVKEGDETIYRVLIQKEGGSVSIDDCVNITNIISPFLDVEEPLSGQYNLEVSSPGIERKLEKPRHYQLSIGEEVEVTTNDKTKYKGKLIDVDDSGITIQDRVTDSVKIEFEDIKKGKTIFSF